MKKIKETSDSIFTLDELIQESFEMNNFLKRKINQQFGDDNNFENLTKFFFQKIKLRNASKNIFWERNNLSNNVSIK